LPEGAAYMDQFHNTSNNINVLVEMESLVDWSVNLYYAGDSGIPMIGEKLQGQQL